MLSLLCLIFPSTSLFPVDYNGEDVFLGNDIAFVHNPPSIMVDLEEIALYATLAIPLPHSIQFDWLPTIFFHCLGW